MGIPKTGKGVGGGEPSKTGNDSPVLPRPEDRVPVAYAPSYLPEVPGLSGNLKPPLVQPKAPLFASPRLTPPKNLDEVRTTGIAGVLEKKLYEIRERFQKLGIGTVLVDQTLADLESVRNNGDAAGLELLWDHTHILMRVFNLTQQRAEIFSVIAQFQKLPKPLPGPVQIVYTHGEAIHLGYLDQERLRKNPMAVAYLHIPDAPGYQRDRMDKALEALNSPLLGALLTGDRFTPGDSFENLSEWVTTTENLVSSANFPKFFNEDVAQTAAQIMAERLPQGEKNEEEATTRRLEGECLENVEALIRKKSDLARVAASDLSSQTLAGIEEMTLEFQQWADHPEDLWNVGAVRLVAMHEVSGNFELELVLAGADQNALLRDMHKKGEDLVKETGVLDSSLGPAASPAEIEQKLVQLDKVADRALDLERARLVYWYREELAFVRQGNEDTLLLTEAAEGIASLEKRLPPEELTKVAENTRALLDRLAFKQQLDMRISEYEARISEFVKAGRSTWFLKDHIARYRSMVGLVLSGDVETAQKQFSELYFSETTAQLDKEFGLAKKEVFVKSLMVMTAAGMIVAPVALGMAAAGVGSVAATLAESAAFVAANMTLQQGFTGEKFVTPGMDAGEWGLLGLEFTKEVALAYGLFRVLKVSGLFLNKMVMQEVADRALARMAAEGMPVRSLTQMTAEQSAKFQAYLELGMVGKAVKGAFLFGGEYAAMTGWEAVSTPVAQGRADAIIPSLASVLSPEAMAHRALFLIGLKLTGFMTHPFQEGLREFAEPQIKRKQESRMKDLHSKGLKAAQDFNQAIAKNDLEGMEKAARVLEKIFKRMKGMYDAGEIVPSSETTRLFAETDLVLNILKNEHQFLVNVDREIGAKNTNGIKVEDEELGIYSYEGDGIELVRRLENNLGKRRLKTYGSKDVVITLFIGNREITILPRGHAQNVEVRGKFAFYYGLEAVLREKQVGTPDQQAHLLRLNHKVRDRLMLALDKPKLDFLIVNAILDPYHLMISDPIKGVYQVIPSPDVNVRGKTDEAVPKADPRSLLRMGGLLLNARAEWRDAVDPREVEHPFITEGEVVPEDLSPEVQTTITLLTKKGFYPPDSCMAIAEILSGEDREKLDLLLKADHLDLVAFNNLVHLFIAVKKGDGYELTDFIPKHAGMEADAQRPGELPPAYLAELEGGGHLSAVPGLTDGEAGPAEFRRPIKVAGSSEPPGSTGKKVGGLEGEVPSPVDYLVYRILPGSPLREFLQKGIERVKREFVEGDSLEEIFGNSAALPVFLRERLAQDYVAILPDDGGAVFRKTPAYQERVMQLIHLIDFVEVSGNKVIEDSNRENYAKLKLKTASYFSYGVFDPVSFETEVALMARLLPPEAPVVEIQLNIENIQTIARSKLEASVKKGLEGHRVGTVHVRFHDQKTSLDLEDRFVMDESIPDTPIALSTDVASEGRDILHDIMGEEARDVLREVEGQVPAVQERFWLEMKSLGEKAKPLLKVSRAGANRGKYTVTKGEDAKTEIKSLVEYLHSLSEPIQRGGHFRRVNATPEEAFVFQRDFKPASDPTKTTLFNFLDQTYVLPEWVREKMDAWINQKSDFLRTETSGYLTFEVKDGVKVITDFIPKASTSQSVEYDIEAGSMSRESIDEATIRSTAPGGRIARIIGFDNDPKWKIPFDLNKAIKVHSHFTDSHYHHSPSPGDFGQLGPDGNIRKNEPVAIEAVRTPGLGLIFYQRGNNDRPYQTVIEKPLVSDDRLPEPAREALANRGASLSPFVRTMAALLDPWVAAFPRAESNRAGSRPITQGTIDFEKQMVVTAFKETAIDEGKDFKTIDIAFVDGVIAAVVKALYPAEEVPSLTLIHAVILQLAGSKPEKVDARKWILSLRTAKTGFGFDEGLATVLKRSVDLNSRRSTELLPPEDRDMFIPEHLRSPVPLSKENAANPLARHYFFTGPKIEIPTIRKAFDATVRVGNGSGFLVSNQGHILTNAHVMDDVSVKDKYVEIDGRRILIKKENIIYKRVKRGEEADVALLLIPELAGRAHLELSKNIPENGETVFAIGHPNGFTADGKPEKLVSVGLVSGTREGKLLSTAEVRNGNSGGPLLNDKGEVVGIVSGGSQGGYTLQADAVPVEDFRSLLPPEPHDAETVDLFKDKPTTDPVILEEEAATIKVDQSGGVGIDENNIGYVLNRGLEQSNTFAQATPFGRIEDNINQALAAKKEGGDNTPLRILTIGPGHGVLETELKSLFGDAIIIDTFSLTSILTPAARRSISREYLGNMDVHDLPQGYDRVISIFGTNNPLNQRRVVEQVISALVVNGEALFTLHNIANNRTNPFVIATGRRDNFINRGIDVGEIGAIPVPARVVYLRKSLDVQNLDWLAEKKEFFDGYNFQLIKNGPYRHYEDKQELEKVVRGRTDAILQEMGVNSLSTTQDRRARQTFNWIISSSAEDVIWSGFPVDFVIRKKCTKSTLEAFEKLGETEPSPEGQLPKVLTPAIVDPGKIVKNVWRDIKARLSRVFERPAEGELQKMFADGTLVFGREEDLSNGVIQGKVDKIFDREGIVTPKDFVVFLHSEASMTQPIGVQILEGGMIKVVMDGNSRMFAAMNMGIDPSQIPVLCRNFPGDPNRVWPNTTLDVVIKEAQTEKAASAAATTDSKVSTPAIVTPAREADEVSRLLKAGDDAIVRWYEENTESILHTCRERGDLEGVAAIEAFLARVHRGERGLEKEWLFGIKDTIYRRLYDVPHLTDIQNPRPSANYERKTFESANHLLDALSYGALLRAEATTDNPVLILNQFLRGELGREPTRSEVAELIQVNGHEPVVAIHSSWLNIPTIHLIFTKEFLDAYAADLARRVAEFHNRYGKDPVVVEICAGDGRFTRALNRRLEAVGVSVRIKATDIKGSGDVVSLDAVAATKEADIILANWMPEMGNFDVDVAKEVLMHPEKTFVLGTAAWGETNSYEFGAFVDSGSLRVETPDIFTGENRPFYPLELSGDWNRSRVLVLKSPVP